MKTTVSKAFSKYFLFFAFACFVTFSPSVGKAQNTVNLAETEWESGSIIVPVFATDNSITTVNRFLIFYKGGKAEASIQTNKSAGGEYKYVYAYEPESVYNGATGRYETQTVYKMVYKYVQTLPVFTPEAYQGAYEIKGKSVFVDFPSFQVNMTVNGNSMKGVVTYKGTNEKAEWILARTSWNQRSNPSNGNSNSANLSENRSSALTGNWEGTYSCGQGLTNLTLSISQSNSSEISAVFKFSANTSNPSIPSGSYRMVGTYDSKTNKITLQATDWINQPSGYVTVDLVGKILQGNTKMSGEVVNSSCTTFTLEKK